MCERVEHARKKVFLSRKYFVSSLSVCMCVCVCVCVCVFVARFLLSRPRSSKFRAPIGSGARRTGSAASDAPVSSHTKIVAYFKGEERVVEGKTLGSGRRERLIENGSGASEIMGSYRPMNERIVLHLKIKGGCVLLF